MTAHRSLPLAGLRIVEISAFVAAPLAAMTLAQLGAEVIRIDPIGGNIDFHRWPLAPSGNSIYWSSLNKAKKSVSLDLNTIEGQEIATSIICAAGEGGGIVLSNLPARGWLSYEALSQRRPDLIMMRLTGNFDGSAAVDYTINCSSGFPIATGDNAHPINHVLPAWDVAAGLYLATGILSAERVRRLEGYGQEVTLALSDVMLATVANLGYIGDVQINGVAREPIGNHLYGAFGRNFVTADQREIMVAAISNRQWKALGTATGLMGKLELIEPMMDVDLTTEGGRFHARHAIAAVLEPWFLKHSVAEIEKIFHGSGVLWGIYRDFKQLVEEDPRCSILNPLFSEVEQPGIGKILSPRIPLSFAKTPANSAQISPQLGENGTNILQELLGMSSDEIQVLQEKGILSGSSSIG